MPDGIDGFEYIEMRNGNKSVVAGVAVGVAVGSMMIAIHGAKVNRSTMVEWVHALQSQITQLKIALQETRAEFALYLQDAALTEVHADIIGVQLAIDQWAEQNDPQFLYGALPLSRSCFVRLQYYLLSPPDFISDEGYLRLEELATVSLTQEEAISSILSEPGLESEKKEKFALRLSSLGHDRHEAMLNRVHTDCAGFIETVNDELNAMMISQRFGFVDQSGGCRLVSRAEGEPHNFRTEAARGKAEEARKLFIADILANERSERREFYANYLKSLSA